MSVTASNSDIPAWDLSEHCRSVETVEVRLSKGFLRSQPARWFPALPQLWAPILHATGADFQCSDVRPALTDAELFPLAGWTLDDEPAVLFGDEDSKHIITEVMTPGANAAAAATMMQYLARRLAVTLQASWSGMENCKVIFDGDLPLETIRPFGWIAMNGSVNNQRVSFSLGLGKMMVDKLDGLWRRQVRNQRKDVGQKLQRVELTRLAVTPQALPDYLRAGSLIDLEIPVTNQVTVRLGDTPWLSAQLCRVGARLAFETVSTQAFVPKMPEGTTPLAIELSSQTIDATVLPEIEQIGAITELESPASNQVHLVIRGEKVGRGQLLNYEGRFALAVL